MNIAAFLVGMVGPLMARWLTSMGFTLVTMAGLAAAVASLKALMLQHLGSLPAEGLMLAGLFGIWESIGMVLGSLTFCITWATTKGFWTLAKA